MYVEKSGSDKNPIGTNKCVYQGTKRQVNIQPSIYFTYNSNEHLEFEIESKNINIIAPKFKCLGINLIKCV